MKISCSKCGTAYDVDAKQVPPSGLRMKCTVCFFSFSVMPPADAGGGVELDDIIVGEELQLTNDPSDIPGAPRGYIDPTTPGSETADIPGLSGEVMDLPGLPGVSPPSSPPLVPPAPPAGGAPAGQMPATSEISDLPGLPSHGGEVSDLPGLPSRGAAPSGAAASSRPAALVPPAPPAAPEVSDLPGLRAGGGEVMDLPGLPSSAGSGGAALVPPAPPTSGTPAMGGAPQMEAGAEISDLPGLPSQPQEVSDLPGLPPSGGLSGGLPPLPSSPPSNAGGPQGDMGLVDLPGLPSAPSDGGLIDLPGLPGAGGGSASAPAGLTDLPGLPESPAPPPRKETGMDYGQITMEATENLSLDLDELPLATGGGLDDIVDVPAPSGNVGLPTPARAGGQGSDIPLPAGTIDLPTPARAPAAPKQDWDIEPKRESGPTFTPTPAASTPSLPATAPGPTPAAQDVGEVIDFAPPPSSIAMHETTEVKPPVEGKKGALFTLSALPKPALFGGGAALLLLLVVGALALFTDIFGGDGKKKPPKTAAASLDSIHDQLTLDTPADYRKAKQGYEAAASGLEAKARIATQALAAQAAAAQAVRFGLRQGVGQAETILRAIKAGEQPPTELKVAQALLLFARGNTKQAAKDLAKISNAHPQSYRAATYLGWAQLALKKAAKARSAFRRALAKRPTSAAALFGQAQTEKAASAQKLLQKALAQSPKHGGALLLLAKTLLAEKKTNQAQVMLARAAVLAKKKTLARQEQAAFHEISAQLAVERGQINIARKGFNKALKLDARRHGSLMGLGKLMLAANQYKQAVKMLSRANAIRPSDLAGGLLLTEAMLAYGKPMDARDIMKKLAKKHGKVPRVQLMLGRVEESLKAIDPAIKHYRAATKLDPKLFESYLYLSRLYLKKEQRKLAFGILQQAQTELKDARVHNAFGEAHLALGELAKAQQRFESAVELDGKHNGALFNLATVLQRLKRSADALTKLEQLAKRDKRYPGLDAARGAALLALGRNDEAGKAYQQALAAVESPPVELRLQAAKAFIAIADYARAAAQTKTILLEQPALTDARVVRAEALLGLDKRQDASVEVNKALAKKKSVDGHRVQALIFTADRRAGDAIAAYGAALAIDPMRHDLRLRRAELQVRGGAVKDGLKELKKVLAAMPKNGKALMLRGIALEGLGKEAKAMASYQAAVTAQADLGEAHLRLAQMLTDRRKLGPAHKHLQQAAAVGKKGAIWLPEAVYSLGKLELKRNDKKAAIAAFQRYLNIAPAMAANRPEAVKKLEALGVKTKYSDPE